MTQQPILALTTMILLYYFVVNRVEDKIIPIKGEKRGGMGNSMGIIRS
jgi:hypothetical protein